MSSDTDPDAIRRAVRLRIASEIRQAAQHEGPRAQRVIEMCAKIAEGEERKP